MEGRRGGEDRVAFATLAPPFVPFLAPPQLRPSIGRQESSGRQGEKNRLAHATLVPSPP